MTVPTKHVFTITAVSGTKEVVGRAAAVKAAKSLSEKGRGPVTLERQDQRFEMSFLNGNVTSYKYAERSRRS